MLAICGPGARSGGGLARAHSPLTHHDRVVGTEMLALCGPGALSGTGSLAPHTP